MALTPGKMDDSIIRNLPKKRGRSFDEWMDYIKINGPENNKEHVNWLKEKHGLGSIQEAINTGRIHRPADWKPKTDVELLAGQFSGEKESMRLVYELLVNKIKKLGDDIEIAPRKSMVSLHMRKTIRENGYFDQTPYRSWVEITGHSTK
jgi:hypothetical protein